MRQSFQARSHRSVLKFIFPFVSLVGFLLTAQAQVSLQFSYPPVYQAGKTLAHAFAGGINSAQYQTIDIEGDGDLDLILFDRTSQQLSCFENTGKSYTYRPALTYLFPTPLYDWIVLVDYDCDGKKDLFTSNGRRGIRVFKNNRSGSKLSWALISTAIETTGLSKTVFALTLNPNDLPAIADIDEDGDVDILAFPTAENRIRYYRNDTKDSLNICGLIFKTEKRGYGDILECLCNEFKIGKKVRCDNAGNRMQHVVARALAVIDKNHDQRLDLVISQEDCPKLDYFENEGTKFQAVFRRFTDKFPNAQHAVHFNTFPAAFFEEVTFDGKPDIIYSTNAGYEYLTTNFINVKSSSFVFPNHGRGNANAFQTQAPFLQQEMIDVGMDAYPALFDADADGNTDLIIGNYAGPLGKQKLASLAYYRSNGQSLTLVSEDWMGLSALNVFSLKPQFIDLDQDGRLDLVFSASVLDKTGTHFHYILQEFKNKPHFDPKKVKTINFKDSLHVYDYTFFNENGKYDLLVSLSSRALAGRLDYYKNEGSNLSPKFKRVYKGFLKLQGGLGKQISLAVGNIDSQSGLDLITIDQQGVLRAYSDFKTGQAVAQTNTLQLRGESTLSKTRFGIQSKPTTGYLMGKPSVVVGGVAGGVHLLLLTSAIKNGNEPLLKLALVVAPTIVTPEQTLTLRTNLSGTLVDVFALTGQRVRSSIRLNAYQAHSLNISTLSSGLYVARAQHKTQYQSLKFIVR